MNATTNIWPRELTLEQKARVLDAAQAALNGDLRRAEVYARGRRLKIVRVGPWPQGNDSETV